MKPFVTWVGGKTQLLPQILDLVGDPQQYAGYCEPFVGGGAVFWALRDVGMHAQAILGDINAPLMRAYKDIQLAPGEIAIQLERMAEEYAQDPSGYYYLMRTLWNSGAAGTLERAQTTARFIFLKQAAFNGLWRENRQGNMNAPWGHREKISLPTAAQLDELCQALKGVGIYTLEFRRTMFRVVPDGGPWLVYCDPPYWGTFRAYNGRRGWDDEVDQVALARGCKALADKGHRVIYSNTDRPEVRQILDQYWSDAQVHEVYGRRSINSNPQGRGKVPELLVCGGGNG